MVNYYLKIITNVLFIPFFVFCFWSLLATKLWKYYIIFLYILQGKMEKNGKKITQLKWPKYQKPMDENIQGISFRNWLFKLALRDSRTNIFFWFMVPSGIKRCGYLCFINQFSKKWYQLASTAFDRKSIR